MPNSESQPDWPWCEACQSWHHPENPTCRKLIVKRRMNRKKCVNHPTRPSIPGLKPGQGLCEECWQRWQGWKDWKNQKDG